MATIDAPGLFFARVSVCAPTPQTCLQDAASRRIHCIGMQQIDQSSRLVLQSNVFSGFRIRERMFSS